MIDAPRCSARCRAAATRCAGTRSPRTGTSSPASSPSASASTRRRRPRLTAPAGPTTTEHVVRWAYFLALALLVGRARLPAAGRAGGRSPAAAQRASTSSSGVGVVGVLEVGIVAFMPARRGRAPAALRAPALRRSLADLERNALRHGVHRDDARLRARRGARLPRLAHRPRAGCSGPRFLLALGFASGLSLSGHSAVGRRARRGAPSSPTGCTCLRRRSGSAGSCSSRSSSGPLEPELRRAGVPALLAPGDRPDRRARSRPASASQRPAAAAPRPISGTSATGRCCS